MNIGDFVKTTKEIYGSAHRQCGLIVGFDIDDDLLLDGFPPGKPGMKRIIESILSFVPP